MIQSDGSIVVTPPAVTKDANKAAPCSVETATETPTGATPEILQVIPVEDPRDDDSIDSAATPRRSTVQSSSRVTLLSQMENAIPSPVSSVHAADIDISTMASPHIENGNELFLSTLPEADSTSNETPFKPNKLMFAEQQDIPEMTMSEELNGMSPNLYRTSHLSVPYAMAPVESYASIPFDCRDDMGRSMFPPSPESEDSFELQERRRDPPKKLVRTLFGWVETSPKKRAEPIKARVLSDRDFGLPHRLDLAASTPNLPVIPAEEPAPELMVETRFRPAMDGPGYSALIASKWFGSQTLIEDDPPRIEHVKEAIIEDLEEKIEEQKRPRQKRPRQKRPWGKICFYLVVVTILLVIIVVASMLLVDKVKGKEVTVAELEQDDAVMYDDAMEADDAVDADDSTSVDQGNNLFPGGFFSTSNQFCTGAVKLDRLGVAYGGNTKGSTRDETIDACGDFMSIGRAAWFAYKAETSQLIEASTCNGTDFDTQITITSGGNCESLNCVTFDDQGCGDQSRAIWYAEAGETYFINIHGFRDARGEYSLTLNPAQSHDECASAEGPVVVGSTVFGTTTGSSIDSDVPQCGDVNLMQHPGVWYALEDVEGWLRAEVVTRHTGFLPQISVYSGVGCGVLTCEGGSTTGSLAWRAISGRAYYVLVNGLNTAHGDFDLSITWEIQDTCEYATPILVNDPAFPATTTDGRLHDVPACGKSGFHTAPGMWFSVNGTGNMLSATTCGANSDLDSHITIFRNGCNALQCLGSTGQDLPCGASGAVSWFSESDVEYTIYVSGRGARVGDFALKVADSSMEAGGVCQSPVALGSGTITVSGTTVDAPQVSTACGNVTSTRGVWYELEGSGNTIILSTCDPNTTFDARISIFTGECDSLTCEAFTTSSCRDLTEEPFQFNTVAGVKYSLLVHGTSQTDVGSFTLSLSSNSLNSACASALPIAASANTYFGTTEGFSGGRAIECADGEGASSGGPIGAWYSFVGTGAQFSFSTCSESTMFATNITVFTGTCFNPTCVETEFTPCNRQGVVSFPTIQGDDYFIRVSGANATEFGNFVVGVSVRSTVFGW